MSGYAFLRKPRWVALAFVVLLVVPSFVLLSRWQISRLDERRHANAVISANAQSAPADVASVMTAGAPTSTVGDEQTWRQVTAVGHYDVAAQVLVRKRPFEGRNGFLVATPLVTSSGAVLVVNRGWVEAIGGASATPVVPDPPSGTVTVTGRVQPSEQGPASQPKDLPAGQVTDLDVALVGGSADVFPGYVDLIGSQPAQADGLTATPVPDLSDGPHLSYAMQWIVFALVAIVGFVLLVRREREYAQEESEEAVAGEAAPATTTHTDVA
jgi:cytochrome oxidase assembly protein ShyY1